MAINNCYYTLILSARAGLRNFQLIVYLQKSVLTYATVHSRDRWQWQGAVFSGQCSVVGV
jgi:hypothetical protein